MYADDKWLRINGLKKSTKENPKMILKIDFFHSFTTIDITKYG